jgi:tetratricopeptide (TPR) repeat protein
MAARGAAFGGGRGSGGARADRLSRRWLGALFALALVPRLAFLAELRQSDYFAYPAVDEELYRDWALRIAGGDLRGEGVFYGSPVYPYFLGAVFRVLGHDELGARVVQAFLGAARAPLVAAAGALAFGPAAGLAAGALAALYRTTLFYDAFLLKECVALWLEDAALLALLLALAARARAGGAAAAAVAPAARGADLPHAVAGLLAGTAALAREALAPFIAGATLLVALRPPRSARAGGVFLAAALLPLLGVAIRNQIVAGEFVLLSAQGGQNFYLGNGGDNTTGLATFPANVRLDPKSLEEDFRALASHRSGRELGAAEASSYWLRQALDEMASDPEHAANLWLRKTLLALNAFEAPNVYSIAYFERLSRVVALDPVRFGLVLPLAAMGLLALARRRAPQGGGGAAEPQPRLDRAATGAVLILFATSFAALVVFYVSDRYRLPMMTPLILLAGAGISHGAEALGAARGSVRARRTRLGAWAPALAVAAAAVAVSRVPPALPAGSRGDATPPANLGIALARAGRHAEAIARFEEALAIEPASAPALFGLGTVMADIGRRDEAIAALRRAAAASPRDARVHASLGLVYFASGRADSAAAALAAAAGLDPRDPRILFNLGAARQADGDLAGAREAYAASTRLAPDGVRAWNNLGTVLVALARGDEAQAAFERALADTGYVEPRMNLAALHLDRGAGEDAAALFEWVLARERRREALLGLGKARARAGDAAAARAAFERYLRVAPAGDPDRAEAERALAALE